MSSVGTVITDLPVRRLLWPKEVLAVVGAQLVEIALVPFIEVVYLCVIARVFIIN